MDRMEKCCLCLSRTQDDLNLGEIKRYRGIVVHYYCLLLASTIAQNGQDSEGILGFLSRDIEAEVNRSKERKCNYCDKWGAAVICTYKSCKVKFHLSCGVRNGTGHQFYGEFLSTCHAHRPRQKFDIPVGEICCPICYDVLKFNNKPWLWILWAPCCKKNAYFHRICIQKLALSAGYFFKCPVCNDKEKFQKTMKNYGVFIPDQDASWEREPGAFRELYYRHFECNEENCLCPRGRTHNTNGQWKIILCVNCGSRGIHVGCIPTGKIHPWSCSDCELNSTNVQSIIPVGSSHGSLTISQEEIGSTSVQSISGGASSSSNLPTHHAAQTFINTSICSSPLTSISNEEQDKKNIDEQQPCCSNSLKRKRSENLNVDSQFTTRNDIVVLDDSDEEVIIVDDDDEKENSSVKCIVTADGSILRIRSIVHQEKNINVQGDRNVTDSDPESSTSDYGMKITNVRSLTEHDHESSEEDVIAGTSNQLSNGIACNNYAVINGSSDAKYSNISKCDESCNMKQIVCTTSYSRYQFNRNSDDYVKIIRVSSNTNSNLFDAKSSSSQDNDVVIID